MLPGVMTLGRFSCALEKQPMSAEYAFGKGLTLWEMPGSEKIQAYSCFLQVWSYSLISAPLP